MDPSKRRRVVLTLILLATTILFGILINPEKVDSDEEIYSQANLNQIYLKQIYEIPEPVIEPIVKYAPSYAYCSCVTFVRHTNPKPVPRVRAAGDMTPNSDTPEVNAWVVFYAGKDYGYYGHVASITKIEGNVITIVEGNYNRCRKSIREVNINDSNIKGYII